MHGWPPRGPHGQSPRWSNYPLWPSGGVQGGVEGVGGGRNGDGGVPRHWQAVCGHTTLDPQQLLRVIRDDPTYREGREALWHRSGVECRMAVCFKVVQEIGSLVLLVVRSLAVATNYIIIATAMSSSLGLCVASQVNRVSIYPRHVESPTPESYRGLIY